MCGKKDSRRQSSTVVEVEVVLGYTVQVQYRVVVPVRVAGKVHTYVVHMYVQAT